MLIEAALVCLTLNIYHESRGESLLGQRAVALVTMNRASHDSKKVCDVVFKDKQFSWANGRVMKVGHYYRLDIEKAKDRKAWETAKQHARLALEGRLYDFTKGSTFYHAKRITPYWAKSFKLVTVIGSHKFYVHV